MWSRVSLAWSRLLLRWTRRRWPRVPLWTRRTWLNVAGSVVSVLVAVAAVLVALLAGKGHSSSHSAAASGSTSARSTATGGTTAPPPPGPTLTDTASATTTGTGTATATGTATGTGSASGSPLTEAIARQAVVAYLNAVNARNRVQAGGLICQSLLPTWLQNVDGPNSDFNFTITEARFTGSAPLGGGSLFLHYTLVFSDNTSNTVDFTVIDESGPKICGEQKV